MQDTDEIAREKAREINEDRDLWIKEFKEDHQLELDSWWAN